MFIKEKEYLVTLHDNTPLRLICKKVTKDTKGTLISVDFNQVSDNSFLQLSLDTIQNCINIIEPVCNTEMFQMFINWNNFYKPGIHQDLEYAYKLSKDICETLKIRSYVQKGTGFFSDYDFKKFQSIAAFCVSQEIKNMCPEELNKKLLQIKTETEFAKSLDLLVNS